MKQNSGYDTYIYTPVIENVKAKIWAGVSPAGARASCPLCRAPRLCETLEATSPPSLTTLGCQNLRKAVCYAQLGSVSRVPVILYAFDSRPLNFDLSRQTVNFKHLPSEVKRE